MNISAVIQEESGSDTPWGPAIGAAIVVQLTTLSGVFIVAFNVLYRKWYVTDNDSKEFTNLLYLLQHLGVPSFAVGALLATSVFLIIPEALHLLGGHGSEKMEHAEEGRRLVFMVVRALAEGNEADHSEEHEEHAHENSESEVAWKFGAALMGGFLFPILLSTIFPEPETPVELQVEDSIDEAKNDSVDQGNLLKKTHGLPVGNAISMDGHEVVDYDVEYDRYELRREGSDADVSKPTLDSKETEAMTTRYTDGGSATMVPQNTNSMATANSVPPIPSVVHTKNLSLAVSILLGDFVHNLSDGFFMGTAFLLCSKSLGWAIAASTIYHEMAQEIADYLLLTTHCGFTSVEALILNFISGCSVLVGVVIVLSLDFDEASIGTILSVSAGVYLYIGVGECIPRVQGILRTANVSNQEKLRRVLIFFVFFVAGAVPISLVLLNHGHCEAE